MLPVGARTAGESSQNIISDTWVPTPESAFEIAAVAALLRNDRLSQARQSIQACNSPSAVEAMR